MPIFEFKCTKCQKVIDVITTYEKSEKMNEKEPCKDCDGVLTKQVSLVGFQLRGPDWSSKGNIK